MHNITEYFFSKFPSYVIEVGVLSGKEKKRQKGRFNTAEDTKKYAESHKEEKVQIGITNAELMYIHENGSPLHHIPARPVLQLTIDWVNSSGMINEIISKIIDTYIVTDGNLDEVDKAVERFCLKIQNYARKLIYDKDPRLTPNAPSTIAKKGSDTPLLDTGQLARSITCRKIRI